MLWRQWMENTLLFSTHQVVAPYSITTKVFSVVLLALVKYNYLYVNVGCQGRISDGGVFNSSDLYRGIQSSSLNIPKLNPLPKTGDPCWEEDEYPNIPHMIVGDDALHLADYMTRPYSTNRQLSGEQLVFNYRLSRFHRVSENASRFRLFLSRLNIKYLSSINNVILAGVVLHTMLCEKPRASYMPIDYMDREDQKTGKVIGGQWRESVPNAFLSRKTQSWGNMKQFEGFLQWTRGLTVARKYSVIVQEHLLLFLI